LIDPPTQQSASTPDDLKPTVHPDSIFSGCPIAFAVAGLASTTAGTAWSAFYGRYGDAGLTIQITIFMTIAGAVVGVMYGDLLEALKRRWHFAIRPRLFFCATLFISVVMMVIVCELTRRNGRALSGPLVWSVFATLMIFVTIASARRTAI
jgi:hypothetical protein